MMELIVCIIISIVVPMVIMAYALLGSLVYEILKPVYNECKRRLNE